MNPGVIALMVSIMTASSAAAQEQPAPTRERAARTRSNVYKLDELTWPQIDAFDRQRTLFILPVGMVEEHGPHLPVGADTLGLTYEANAASRRVGAALPQWTVVMMPPVNYGHAGANILGSRMVHPGTYGIRQSTLRSLLADIGGQVAQNGFKWMFVLNGHGGSPHNIAINEACDFVSETFGITMLHVTGLFRADEAIQARGQRMNARHFSPAEMSSFGMDLHAGVSETSGMLAVRPDLVRSSYRSLPSLPGRSLEELQEIASAPGWQGYFSSPSKATAAHGRAVEAWWIDGFTDLIVRAVRGENMSAHSRFHETVPPAVAPLVDKVLANDSEFETKLQTWLAQRHRR